MMFLVIHELRRTVTVKWLHPYGYVILFYHTPTCAISYLEFAFSPNQKVFGQPNSWVMLVSPTILPSLLSTTTIYLT